MIVDDDNDKTKKTTLTSCLLRKMNRAVSNALQALVIFDVNSAGIYLYFLKVIRSELITTLENEHNFSSFGNTNLFKS